MSPAIVTAAGDFTVITNTVRLYIWWQAFRVHPKTLPPVNGSPK
jgi:hypothetical protein